MEWFHTSNGASGILLTVQTTSYIYFHGAKACLTYVLLFKMYGDKDNWMYWAVTVARDLFSGGPVPGLMWLFSKQKANHLVRQERKYSQAKLQPTKTG
jgi:hypothetical protein